MARRRMPSVMKNRFSEVPAANIRRSVFDRSHGHKTTFDAGYLIPIFLDEVLPGDTFSMKHSFVCRMATPIFPLMDNLFLDIHYFFVPNRLVWTDWEEFCGNAEYSGDSGPDHPHISWPIARPYFVPWVARTNLTASPPTSATTVESGSLADYLGLPVGMTFPSGKSGVNALPDTEPYVSALPFFAYNYIYNEWYRDENLIPPLNYTAMRAGSLQIQSSSGDSSNYASYHAVMYKHDDSTSHAPQYGSVGALFRRGKRHDYFTSCLPWPSKGPSVTLRLGGDAPIKGIGVMSRNNDISPSYANAFTTTANNKCFDGAGNAHIQQKVMWGSTDSGDVRLYLEAGTPLADGAIPPNIRADLRNVPGPSINELRQAFQIQKLYERDARGGTRYIEVLRSHFGVTSPDARLQRPEYLGGSSTPIHVAPVPQTSSTSANSPQGNLSAYAVANGTKRCFTKSFVEHGLILGIASVRADLTYQNGMDRMWSRKSRFDYYWPTLAHLGEQAVLNQEIYFDVTPNSTKNLEVFGYQERFAEYRYKNSLITGGMRSSAPNSYAAWHLGQSYTQAPALNQSFIEENPPMDRILALGAATKGKQFIFDGYFNLKCTRPMPVYSVPGLVDHF